MEPVFTLQWPEFVVANELQSQLSKREGYSILIPLSRQEKGIDLAVVRKQPGGASRVATIQVKASKVYMPVTPKRKTTERFRYVTWFNRFDVVSEADFYILFWIYAPDPSRTRGVNHE
jgi:hypothetical protein